VGGREGGREESKWSVTLIRRKLMREGTGHGRSREVGEFEGRREGGREGGTYHSLPVSSVKRARPLRMMASTLSRRETAVGCLAQNRTGASRGRALRYLGEGGRGEREGGREGQVSSKESQKGVGQSEKGRNVRSLP